MNTQIDKSMPADIYSDSIFTMGMDGRGRKDKLERDEVKTTAKGLMKSTSPLPLYSDLVNPVEENYTESVKALRSADQANFMIESIWSQQLFSRQTHPYSNGISSTTLAQIRNMILEKRLGNPYHNGTFQQYMTIFASLMLYNSGGHSFFEIFEVFKLPVCQELLNDESSLKEALDNDNLMFKFLYQDQASAYEDALQATQGYMQVLLNKKILNAQLKARLEDKNEDEHPRSTEIPWEMQLHSAVLTKSVDELEQLLQSLHGNDIDATNDENWTALMVASQLGKTEHVKKLIAAGANVTKHLNGIPPLELAIKSQQFETVELLIENGASLKRGNERSPALYLACRQSDMRILRSLLDKKKVLEIIFFIFRKQPKTL